jgi:hypothetical protein
MDIKRFAAILLAASILPVPAFAQAQEEQAVLAQPTRPLTLADLESMRAELRSTRKQMVAQNLKLTDSEATKFWPVYDRYIADLTKINDDRYTLLAEYLNTFGKYDDKAAASFIARWTDVDARTAALRAKYVPIVGGVLPGLKTASFFQIDRRLQMVIDLKFATQLPILQSQPAK